MGLLGVVAATLSTSVLLSERLAPKAIQLTEHTRIRAFEDPKTIEWFVRGGSSKPVTIQVKLAPHSRLKLAEPESGN